MRERLQWQMVLVNCKWLWNITFGSTIPLRITSIHLSFIFHPLFAEDLHHLKWGVAKFRVAQTMTERISCLESCVAIARFQAFTIHDGVLCAGSWSLTCSVFWKLFDQASYSYYQLFVFLQSSFQVFVSKWLPWLKHAQKLMIKRRVELNTSQTHQALLITWCYWIRFCLRHHDGKPSTWRYISKKYLCPCRSCSFTTKKHRQNTTNLMFPRH